MAWPPAVPTETERHHEANKQQQLTRATGLRHATFQSRQTSGKKAEEGRRRKQKAAAAPAHRAHLKATLGIHTRTPPRAARYIPFYQTTTLPGQSGNCNRKIHERKEGEKKKNRHLSQESSEISGHGSRSGETSTPPSPPAAYIYSPRCPPRSSLDGGLTF